MTVQLRQIDTMFGVLVETNERGLMRFVAHCDTYTIWPDNFGDSMYDILCAFDGQNIIVRETGYTPAIVAKCIANDYLSARLAIR